MPSGYLDAISAALVTRQNGLRLRTLQHFFLALTFYPLCLIIEEFERSFGWFPSKNMAVGVESRVASVPVLGRTPKGSAHDSTDTRFDRRLADVLAHAS